MDGLAKAGIVFVLGMIVIVAIMVFGFTWLSLLFVPSVATFLGVVLIILACAGTVAGSIKAMGDDI